MESLVSVCHHAYHRFTCSLGFVSLSKRTSIISQAVLTICSLGFRITFKTNIHYFTGSVNHLFAWVSYHFQNEHRLFHRQYYPFVRLGFVSLSKRTSIISQAVLTISTL